MSTVPLTRAEFDAKLPQLTALVRDWTERECTSFDQAVLQPADVDNSEGSIWEMPEIDSKRTASLLVELEPLVGCKLPSKLIRRGGYSNAEMILTDLLPKIRDLCADASSTGGGSSKAAASHPSIDTGDT